MDNIDYIVDYIRNRPYMSGIERDRIRKKQTAEVFTPTPLAEHMVASFSDQMLADPTKTIIDPACGDGQILGEVVIARVRHGLTLEQALKVTYGVDIMQDNVDLCRTRLLCGREDLRPIVERNIVCADALTYDYSFKPSVKKPKVDFEDLFDYAS